MKLQEAWENYRSRVLGDEATSDEVSAAERAFFGGAMIVWGELTGDHSKTQEVEHDIILFGLRNGAVQQGGRMRPPDAASAVA